MWPDRVSNPGPLTYESGALPIALRSPAIEILSLPKSDIEVLLNWRDLDRKVVQAPQVKYI